MIDFILLQHFGQNIGPIIIINLHSDDGNETIESRKGGSRKQRDFINNKFSYFQILCK